MTVVIALVILAVVALIAIAVLGRRGRPDDIDSFRRQIDALSPEARRETSDRMKPSDDTPSGEDGPDAQ